MLDLLNGALSACQIKPQEGPRKTYVANTYQEVLMSRLNCLEAPRLTSDSEETVNLDDAIMWRQKKVKEKAVKLLADIEAGKITTRVVIIGFQILKSDGQITSGKWGNLLMKLKAEGYSNGTATAQAMQIVTLFRLLKITEPETSYCFIPNKNSLILKKALEIIKDEPPEISRRTSEVDPEA